MIKFKDFTDLGRMNNWYLASTDIIVQVISIESMVGYYRIWYIEDISSNNTNT